MIEEFRLPDLGEGLTESEIISWQVAVGDTVALNQVIGEVETAKAVVELPSPFAGVVTKIAHQPGTVVDVGDVIISFEVAAGIEPGSEPPARRVPTLVGYGADPETSARPTRRIRSVGDPKSQANRPRSTPPVRKLAKDLGIDLADVSGSGEGGLIVRADVVGFAGTDVPVPAPTAQRETRTPIKGVRKHTAEAMVQSAFTAPHVSEFLTVDVSAGMDFLERLRGQAEFSGVKLSPLTLAAKAVCLAIKRQPSLNSRWDQAAGEIVSMNYLNLGIAAATPRGLIVPNIKEAQELSVAQLGQAIDALAQTARAGKTAPVDLAGGTFTITNIGVFGIDAGTPILNPGEAGILALGAVRRIPWEYQGKVALREVMTLSLSFDHRLVDGEQGSRFLFDVGAVMNDPAMALAWD